MLVKMGVDVSKLRPPIAKKLTIIENSFRMYGYEVVMTSTYEGHHSPSSLHYRNLAVDFRLPVGCDAYDVVEHLSEQLGHDYNVVLECTHVHIEYDPKCHKHEFDKTKDEKETR